MTTLQLQLPIQIIREKQIVAMSTWLDYPENLEVPKTYAVKTEFEWTKLMTACYDVDILTRDPSSISLSWLIGMQIFWNLDIYAGWFQTWPAWRGQLADNTIELMTSCKGSQGLTHSRS